LDDNDNDDNNDNNDDDDGFVAQDPDDKVALAINVQAAMTSNPIHVSTKSGDNNHIRATQHTPNPPLSPSPTHWCSQPQHGLSSQAAQEQCLN
jgi:hypothetical protein